RVKETRTRSNDSTRAIVIIASPDVILDGFDDVAKITGRVPQRLRALRFPNPVERAHHHLRRSRARRRPGRGPLSERIRSEIAAERRTPPRHPAVVRDSDLADAVAAVERDAFQHGLPAAGQARPRL